MRPSPLCALICSATMSASHALAMLIRSPLKKPGSEPGSTTLRTSPDDPRPTLRAASTSRWSTARIAE